MKKKILLLSFMIVMLITLSSCVPGDGRNTLSNPAGFFWGVWQGWMAPISLILGFFDRNIRVYEVYNTGWWYDFGYYIAVISGFGGLSLFRKKKSDKHDK